MLWLKRRNPELLKERRSVRKDAKAWDKVIVKVFSALMMVLYIIVPFDAVRFHWSRVPAVVAWLAFAGVSLAWILVVWAFRENAFLSAIVRIQTDRGHTVCTTGPYKFIRHPLYLANILFVLCSPLFLGSLFALIPAGLIAGLFVLRTVLEDRTLQRELPGYAAYAAETRWKLVPNVW
jgi:protein-S-isoprenylcysteine O-methyltransferase Ste14